MPAKKKPSLSMFPAFAREPSTVKSLAGVLAKPAPASVFRASAKAIDPFVTWLRSVAPVTAVDAVVEDLRQAPEAGDVYAAATISDATVDSYETTFAPDGWVLDDFQRNPQVLWAHDDHNPGGTIGKDVGAHIVPGKSLRGLTRFTSRDLNPLGDWVGNMVRAGFINATSIRFEPLEYKVNPERKGAMGGWLEPIDFTRQILREYSWLPLPSNPNALADGRALKDEGIEMAPFVEWCTRMLDSQGALVIPRAALEEMRAAAVGKSIVLLPGLEVARVRAPEEEDEEKKAAKESETPAEEAPPADTEEHAAEEQPPEETPAENEEGDEDVEAVTLDELARCPSCLFEGRVGGFLIETDPAKEEAMRAAESLPNEVLLSILNKRAAASEGGGVDAQTGPGQAASHDSISPQARVIAAEAKRQLMERTGRLP